MKSLMLIVLACSAVGALAGCNNLQRLKVKQQWAQAFDGGEARVDFGIALWRAVFNQEPSYREYFSEVRGDDEESSEFIAHAQRVLSGLNMVISLLDQPGTVDAALAHLKDQHVERAVPAEAWGVFKKALFATLGSRLGVCLDSEAFDACYDFVVAGIKT